MPESLFKICEVHDDKRGWLYDAYIVKNDVSSTQSPVQFRSTLADVNKNSGFTFLQRIIVSRPNKPSLYDEATQLKGKWQLNRNTAIAGVSVTDHLHEEQVREGETELQMSNKDRLIASLQAKIRVLEEENAELKLRLINMNEWPQRGTRLCDFVKFCSTYLSKLAGSYSGRFDLI